MPTYYQDWLLEQDWADTEGQGWLAALALEQNPDLYGHLHLLIIDGFDEFTPTQLSVLKYLAPRPTTTIITLTGEFPTDNQPSGSLSSSQYRQRIALRRFARDLRRICAKLDLEPEPLPGYKPETPSNHFSSPLLHHLERSLFESDAESMRTEIAFQPKTNQVTGKVPSAIIGDPQEVTMSEWAQQCIDQGGLTVMPHAPNPQCERAADLVLDLIHAVEMMTFNPIALGFGQINPYGIGDWYRYLNLCLHVPVVGDSDKMAASSLLGGIRTYANLGERAFTYENWMAAVRAGNTFVTVGPLMGGTVGRRSRFREQTPSASLWRYSASLLAC